MSAQAPEFIDFLLEIAERHPSVALGTVDNIWKSARKSFGVREDRKTMATASIVAEAFFEKVVPWYRELRLMTVDRYRGTMRHGISGLPLRQGNEWTRLGSSNLPRQDRALSR